MTSVTSLSANGESNLTFDGTNLTVNGNVGIGTVPSAQLEVWGLTKFSNTVGTYAVDVVSGNAHFSGDIQMNGGTTLRSSNIVVSNTLNVKGVTTLSYVDIVGSNSALSVMPFFNTTGVMYGNTLGGGFGTSSLVFAPQGGVPGSQFPLVLDSNGNVGINGYPGAYAFDVVSGNGHFSNDVYVDGMLYTSNITVSNPIANLNVSNLGGSNLTVVSNVTASLPTSVAYTGGFVSASGQLVLPGSSTTPLVVLYQPGVYQCYVFNNAGKYNCSTLIVFENAGALSGVIVGIATTFNVTFTSSATSSNLQLSISNSNSALPNTYKWAMTMTSSQIRF
jgi:hypothetical protein